MNETGPDGEQYRVARLILEMRTAGVTDPVVLNAVERTPREPFLTDDLRAHAYKNCELPIACGQSTTPPVLAARMLQALELGPTRTKTVLEIGTGSGWTTRVLAGIARRVVSIERYRSLYDTARTLLSAADLDHVALVHGDGLEGWEKAGPFDRIIAYGAREGLPPAWFSQIKPGGLVVMAMGTNEHQQICRIRRNEMSWEAIEPLAPSAFLHLSDGVARET